MSWMDVDDIAEQHSHARTFLGPTMPRLSRPLVLSLVRLRTSSTSRASVLEARPDWRQLLELTPVALVSFAL